ncbi:hypothetical protein UK23_33240 [Lentzea aerocolonigenes]|uniref:Uncharacterized protein n=1 Tax=Lentzea aerocolonigenes TaxID=68170 RepID=A0A0F0GJE1_LENAE|nr:YbaB/EbfC family nucleoid-associated protein [Lentzea aerocolonigenes]KJK43450.1 hypothetical protein UK23_33240 [Lentzea aerocolonigenes]
MSREHAAYAELADDIRRIQREMAGVEATAESDDGLVSVTVGPRGELVAVELDPRVYRNPDATGLAAEIVRVAGEATRAAQRKTVSRLGRLLPADGTDVDFDPVLHQLDRVADGQEPAWPR